MAMGRVGVEVDAAHQAQPAAVGAAERRDGLRERDRLAHGRREVELVMVVEPQDVGLRGHVDRQAGVDVDRGQRLLLDVDLDRRRPRDAGSAAALGERRVDVAAGEDAAAGARQAHLARDRARRAARSSAMGRSRDVDGIALRLVPGRRAQQVGDVIAEHGSRSVGERGLRRHRAPCRPAGIALVEGAQAAPDALERLDALALELDEDARGVVVGARRISSASRAPSAMISCRALLGGARQLALLDEEGGLLLGAREDALGLLLGALDEARRSPR